MEWKRKFVDLERELAMESNNWHILFYCVWYTSRFETNEMQISKPKWNYTALLESLIKHWQWNVTFFCISSVRIFVLRWTSFNTLQMQIVTLDFNLTLYVNLIVINMWKSYLNLYIKICLNPVNLRAQGIQTIHFYKI